MLFGDSTTKIMNLDSPDGTACRHDGHGIAGVSSGPAVESIAPNEVRRSAGEADPRAHRHCRPQECSQGGNGARASSSLWATAFWSSSRASSTRCAALRCPRTAGHGRARGGGTRGSAHPLPHRHQPRRRNPVARPLERCAEKAVRWPHRRALL